MSTSDGRPLTRRQLRELRQTGQTPIIPAEDRVAADVEEAGPAEAPAAEPEDASPESEAEERDASGDDDRIEDPDPEPTENDTTPDRDALPEESAHADEPGAEPEEPATADTAVVEETPASEPVVLTRRQRREQERIRTHAVPLVVEGAVPHDADEDGASEPAEAEIVVEPVADPGTDAPGTGESGPDAGPADDGAAGVGGASASGAGGSTPAVDVVPAATVRPDLGANVSAERPVTPPPSFDELLTHPHDSTGSSSAPSALILDEIPTAALNAPVTSTGELLVTSSHKLPDGFGSRGVAKGTTDGREVDAVLIDGELPLASSPTPIAASNAVSTSKSPGEVIRPPGPEKNHRLVLTLGITAGGLGIVVVAAVIVAYATGVFG